MYILSCKLALFCGSGMKIRGNVCGCILAERHKVYILSYKMAFFCGSGTRIRLNVCGGISAERPNM